jgi:hypothetical protein
LIALCLLGWAKIRRDMFLWSADIGQQGISAEYHEKSTFTLAASTPHCIMHCLESGTRVQLATCAPLSAEADLHLPLSLAAQELTSRPKSGRPSAFSGTLAHNRPPNIRFGGLRAEERTAWNYPGARQDFSSGSAGALLRKH